jgi:hypothetical protein
MNKIIKICQSYFLHSMLPLANSSQMHSGLPNLALNALKGTVSRNFWPSVFFTNQVSLGLWLSSSNIFKFGFDFAEISGICVDSTLCRIAQSQLHAVTTRKFWIEFHVQLHSAESAMKFFVKFCAMPHSTESRLRAMWHSRESKLCAMWHSAESIP